MRRKNLTIEQVEDFLMNRLAGRLKRDLVRLKMVKESDLECCIYYHLRQFLHGDNNWRVFARRYSPQTEHYIDFLIFRKRIPQIALELKWNRKRISRKDRKSLNKSLTQLKVDKAYFITTLVGDDEYQETVKEEIEKDRLIEIVIPLGLSGARLAHWEEKRRQFKRCLLVKE